MQPKTWSERDAKTAASSGTHTNTTVLPEFCAPDTRIYIWSLMINIYFYAHLYLGFFSIMFNIFIIKIL